MRLNRKSVSAGVVGLAFAGALVGGGIAAAASASPSAGVATTSATAFVGGGGHSGHMSDISVGAGSLMTAAASYLGLSRVDLESSMQKGMSLADVAKAQARTVSGLEASMTAGLNASLRGNTTLTAAQRATIRTDVLRHLHAMVTMTHSTMGMGMGFGDEMGTGLNSGMGTAMSSAANSPMGSAMSSGMGSGMNGMGS